MPGLNLRGNASVGGGYSPWTPAVNNTSTAGGVTGGTISQMAYGINGTGGAQISPIPAYGAIGAGVAAVAILAFIWYSLPR